MSHDGVRTSYYECSALKRIGLDEVFQAVVEVIEKHDRQNGQLPSAEGGKSGSSKGGGGPVAGHDGVSDPHTSKGCCMLQ